jgi:hypothetical protein
MALKAETMPEAEAGDCEEEEYDDAVRERPSEAAKRSSNTVACARAPVKGEERNRVASIFSQNIGMPPMSTEALDGVPRVDATAAAAAMADETSARASAVPARAPAPNTPSPPLPSRLTGARPSEAAAVAASMSASR